MTEVTSTWKISSYRWRRSQTDSISSSRSTKARSTSQDFRPTEFAEYQLPLIHNLSHNNAGIRKDTSYKLHSNPISWHASYHPATRPPGVIPRIHINEPGPSVTNIQKNSRHSKIPTNFSLLISLWQASVSERVGSSVVIKSWPPAGCWNAS